jgi:hypothetical protein
MHISHHITRQLASEHIRELRAAAPPRRTRRRFRLRLRRLRILARRPFAVSKPGAAL